MNILPDDTRPDTDEYQDWLDSLPECRNCEGTGYVNDDFGHERTCGPCDGSGKEFSPVDDD